MLMLSSFDGGRTNGTDRTNRHKYVLPSPAGLSTPLIKPLRRGHKVHESKRTDKLPRPAATVKHASLRSKQQAFNRHKRGR